MAKIAYRYVGGGFFFPGLPARDLTLEEAVAFGALFELALKAGLYEPVREKKPAEKSKPGKKGD